jgi:hypothetical protein
MTRKQIKATMVIALDRTRSVSRELTFPTIGQELRLNRASEVAIGWAAI